jgi:RNA polymerase sigma factor (sigma-70 family)
LRRLVRPKAVGATDAHLLERFVTLRDEAAFELLVWRYGPLVLNVCRRVLRHPHDAEDAFQATFLTLVRKASSIGKYTSVSSWLYKVAYRIALQARRSEASQKNRERQAARPAVALPEEPLDTDLHAALAEEVSRLPEKYRAAVVLCYFLGKTHEEAARRLGCPKGTVAVRLMRARDRLRGRLERRGLTLSAGMVAAALAEREAVAISDQLVQNTLRSVLLLAAGRGLVAGGVSLRVIALLEGAVKAMWWTQVKLAAGTVLVLASLGAGGGWIAFQAAGDEPAVKQEKAVTQKEEKPAKTKADDPKAHSKQLEAALIKERDDLRKTAEDWEKFLFEHRLERCAQIVALEEELRLVQREQALRREKELAHVKELEQAVRSAEKQVNMDKSALENMVQEKAKSPSIGRPNYRPEDIKEMEGAGKKSIERLDNLMRTLGKDRQEFEAHERKRTEELIQARKRLVEEEETLRYSERAAQRQRERMQRDIDLVELRLLAVRREMPAAGNSDLDRVRNLDSKLDRLLQEVDGLRREVRELKGAGGRSAGDGPGARES